MKLGVVFPQVEIEADPAAIRCYAQAVEDLGFDHVLVYDHVTGIDPASHKEFADLAHRSGATSTKPYDVYDSFHEVMVLLGFLSAVCSLDFITGVLVLPQRQTPLVAKQAAEVDVLSEGRLRLGVGIGWNALEYRSMGREFHTRGARIEEQIDLLRRFWTDQTVRFTSDEHWADGVGISPRPVQRPIPIWLGAGNTAKALARVGRIADGWLPVGVDPADLAPQLDLIRAAAGDAGRDARAIGIQGRLERAGAREPGDIASEIQAWRGLGATHLAINTMRCGLTGAQAHVKALAALAPALTTA
jgi:probable F420-dependent oxidoreductase